VKKLTDKQEKFCNEYLIDLNATQAAIRSGYSKDTANRIGPENLSKLGVAERIAELQKELKEKSEVTPEKVVKELANIGFSNIADVLDINIPNGEIETAQDVLSDMQGNFITLKDGKGLKDLPRNISALISEVKMTKDGLAIKLYDKLNAMDKLMKHLGMFEKDNHQKKTEVTVDVSNMSTDELMKRVEALKSLDSES
jgi:phage terminase small subunit